MPAFQMPAVTGKRKSEHFDDNSRKRQALDTVNDSQEQFWSVQWRTPQNRKHKTWDGDAILMISGSRATMYDMDGKSMGSGSIQLPLFDGKMFNLCGKDIEIERSIPREEYLSGLCFGRGISVPVQQSAGPSKQFVPLTINSPKKALSGIPLQPVDLISTPASSNLHFEPLKTEDSHWSANWRKIQSSSKKNITWDGDAFVSHLGQKLVVVTEDGKPMGSSVVKGGPITSGYRFFMGGKQLQLASEILASQLPNAVHDEAENDAPKAAEKKVFIPPSSFYGISTKPKKLSEPLHDPFAEDAIVFKAPTKEHMKAFNKRDSPVVAVVVDPIIARKLRPHQVEGVKFLYECVMGLRKHEGQGCILADEMGLGKTLQTIALVWTLLKQNPYATGRPVVQKVLIVCPVSLVDNWKAEFHKWLGKDRVGVAVYKDKNTVKTYMNAPRQQVMVLGYERLRTVVDDLASCIPPIGLIICDEGHRLKSANNKTTTTFDRLRTVRRVILSGTPIQNDLGEFHAMADFCNPGLLDDYSTFKRVYESPILKSRAPDSTKKEQELGDKRTEQLMSIAKSFVLRREATILGNYLPPKHEYIVFIKPTPLQFDMFSKLLREDKLDDLTHSNTADALALINLLKKVSNSPVLIKATIDKANDSGDALPRAGLQEAVALLPDNARIEDMTLSGKLIALSKLLKAIRKNTEEKCVLVSHYTSTLNVLEAYLVSKKYSYYRLDGQTPAAKRQEYVNAFNKSSQSSSFIFLLSSKAGGVGINLVGASRLCLIDSDWNPSHDLQAMARCHRDGQKRPVFIYRFMSAGTIDEKIYQRQVTKLGLSNSLMGSSSSNSKVDSFSSKDLRDIFKIHPETSCSTHDLLDCCGSSTETIDSSMDEGSAHSDGESDTSHGFIIASSFKPEKLTKADKEYLQKKKEGLAALGDWKHIDCLRSIVRDEIQDEILRQIFLELPTVEAPTPTSDSNLDRLLAAVDIDAIEKMDQRLHVRDVPGGTISFLFEKSSVEVVAMDE
ncbi:SNF2 family N-terminal domain-containing protein [Mycena floridula]|nr:SNF2 family N-terminal domain-containing protein [Mycena floridula]